MSDPGAPEPLEPEVETVVRTTSGATQAGDWALVLAAAGIPYRLAEHDGRFALAVAGRDAAAAQAALAGYDAEAPVKPEPPAPDAGPSVLGVLSAAILAVMFYRTGPATEGSVWFAAGAASAQRILDGQWWRLLTALTLHADLLHLAGNAIACLVFVAPVGRWLGGGLGALAILGAAAVANLITALAHRTDFVSVGASTATFAALGIVAGLQVVRRLRGEARRRYAWVPLGAGLGLYAMLGVGPGADTYAHLFGLASGAAIGVGAALGGVRAPRRTVQVLLGAVALAIMAGCWVLAFRAAR